MSENQDNAQSFSQAQQSNKPQTELISAAFAKAQGQFKQPELNRTAEIKKDGKLLYETQYADLNQCIECIRKPLSDNELSFTQTIEPSQGGWLLVLTLRHSSGQVLKSFLPIRVDGSPQVVGGQLTYFKRYQISAFFGLAADFDDDGNAGTGNTGEFGNAKKKSKDETKGNQDKVKNEQATTPSEKPRDPVAPKDIIYPFESSIKGKKIGEVDTPTLTKAAGWLKGEMNKDPKPKNLKQIAFIYAQVKAVLVDRNPPPDDIPENMNQDTGEMPPEDEGQLFPPDDTTPSIDDYVIPKGILATLDDIAGIPLKKISEKELRAVQKILDDEMKKGPKSEISSGVGFEIRNKITEFLKSMGG